MRIRFVFTAIQHDDTRIAPVESSVGFIAHIVEKTAQADRIGIAYLMVATDIEDRHPVGSDRFVQFTEETGSLVMIGRIIDAVTIENDKIIFQILHLLIQCLQSLGMFMQVVEYNGRKIGVRRSRQSKSMKIRNGCFSKHFLISLIEHDFLRTNPVIIGFSRFQSVQSDFILQIVADHLPIHDRTSLLQVLLIGSVFHPAISRDGSLPHDRNSISYRILQIGLRTEYLARRLIEDNIRDDWAVVGSGRLIPYTG